MWPSNRGELDITGINQTYLERGMLNVEVMGRGVAWLDTRTRESLLDAACFIANGEQRQEMEVACPGEITCRKGCIFAGPPEALTPPLLQNEYGRYLVHILGERVFQS